MYKKRKLQCVKSYKNVAPELTKGQNFPHGCNGRGVGEESDKDFRNKERPSSREGPVHFPHA